MVEYVTVEWNSFKRLDFDFQGRRAILVCSEIPVFIVLTTAVSESNKVCDRVPVSN